MINVIVPVVEDAEKFKEFVSRESGYKVRFFVGVKQKYAQVFCEKIKNVEVHVFADKSKKEEIINSLHTCKMKRGKILIVRRPLSAEEFKKLTNSQADITTLVGRHNKFFSLLKNWGTYIVKKFFAFSFFEDISAIIYGEDMFELMSVCANISMATRVNKYVGVQIDQIETTSKPARKEFSRLKATAWFLLWNLVLFGSIAGGILVCIFTNRTSMTILLVIFWIIVALLAYFAGMISFVRMVVVGNLRYGRAEEIVLAKKSNTIVPQEVAETIQKEVSQSEVVEGATEGESEAAEPQNSENEKHEEDVKNEETAVTHKDTTTAKNKNASTKTKKSENTSGQNSAQKSQASAIEAEPLSAEKTTKAKQKKVTQKSSTKEKSTEEADKSKTSKAKNSKSSTSKTNKKEIENEEN